MFVGKPGSSGLPSVPSYETPQPAYQKPSAGYPGTPGTDYTMLLIAAILFEVKNNFTISFYIKLSLTTPTISNILSLTKLFFNVKVNQELQDYQELQGQRANLLTRNHNHRHLGTL